MTRKGDAPAAHRTLARRRRGRIASDARARCPAARRGRAGASARARAVPSLAAAKRAVAEATAGALAARAIEAARRRGGRARVGPARARGAGRDAASDAAARSEEAASMCGGGVARSRRTMMSRQTRRFVEPDFLIFLTRVPRSVSLDQLVPPPAHQRAHQPDAHVDVSQHHRRSLIPRLGTPRRARAPPRARSTSSRLPAAVPPTRLERPRSSLPRPLLRGMALRLPAGRALPVTAASAPAGLAARRSAAMASRSRALAAIGRHRLRAAAAVPWSRARASPPALPPPRVGVPRAVPPRRRPRRLHARERGRGRGRDGRGGANRRVPLRGHRGAVAEALGGEQDLRHPGPGGHVQAQVLRPRHVPLPQVRRVYYPRSAPRPPSRSMHDETPPRYPKPSRDAEMSVKETLRRAPLADDASPFRPIAIAHPSV